MAISRLPSIATGSTVLFTNLLRQNRSPAVVSPLGATRSFFSSRFVRSIHIGMPPNYTDKEAVEQSSKWKRGTPIPLFGFMSGDNEVYVRIDNMLGVGKEGMRIFPQGDYYLIEGAESDTDEDEEEESVYLSEMFVDPAYVMKDDVFDLFGAASGVMGGGWGVKEDGDAVYLRMDMPGLTKESVNISVVQNTSLIIKGEGEKESEEEDDDDDYLPRYSGRIDLPLNLYKMDEIKAEMKNGVLKVVVPKMEEEERKDVFQVKVD